MDQRPEGEPARWLDHKRNVDKVFYVLAALSAVVALADVAHLYHKHGHFPFEQVPAFHAMFGFVAYVGLITVSKGLRKLVMRDENYYGEAAPEPAHAHEPTHGRDAGDAAGPKGGGDA